MFKVNEYKIVFKRLWHCKGIPGHLGTVKNGRYDTKCEIWLDSRKGATIPSFTGIAKLHPNDKPDKIIGKKIALRNTLANMYPSRSECRYVRKLERTAIWKAFWKWMGSWPHQVALNSKNEEIERLSNSGSGPGIEDEYGGA